MLGKELNGLVVIFKCLLIPAHILVKVPSVIECNKVAWVVSDGFAIVSDCLLMLA